MSVLTEILISSLLSLLFAPQGPSGKTTTEEQIVVLEQVREEAILPCTTYCQQQE